LDTLVLLGIILVVAYVWSQNNQRKLENGKALSELSSKALQTNGYQLVSWGKESKKGKTASVFPQKYEKEYVLEGVPFCSYIELETPEKDSAKIGVNIYSGIVCFYRDNKNGGRMSKLNELDVRTLEIRAWQNFKANNKQ
jgi:hypothetical protein